MKPKGKPAVEGCVSSLLIKEGKQTSFTDLHLFLTFLPCTHTASRCSLASEVIELSIPTIDQSLCLTLLCCITPMLPSTGKELFYSLPATEQNSSELVKHFLIESSAKGVRVKGSSQEPYFGKYRLIHFAKVNRPSFRLFSMKFAQ